MDGQVTIANTLLFWEIEDDKAMFWNEQEGIEFELSNRTGRIDLDYIERYDQNSNDFFNDNWEEIFESVGQHF